jgi:threonine synthase
VLEQEQYVTVADTLCVRCGASAGHEFRVACESCGGLLENVYRLRGQTPSLDFTNGFDCLLPQFARALRARLPRLPVTPCWNDDELADEIGVAACYVKDETRNHTGTTKDRMAAVALTSLVALGVRELAVSSTGNSSTSYAWAAQYLPEVRLHIFAGREFTGRVRNFRTANVSLYVVDGDFVEASRAAAGFARSTPDVAWEGGFFNPYRRDGLKLTYLESYSQMPVLPTVVVQAVSSGMGIMAAAQATSEWWRCHGLNMSFAPRYLCVQQESCAPMVTAWAAGRRVIARSDIVRKPTGIAKAILRGDPSGAYPYLSARVAESGGAFTSVNVPQIRSAQAALLRRGVPACPAGAAALAGVRKAARAGQLRRDDVVLVNVTGTDHHESADG